MERKVRVGIVSRNEIVREGLRRILIEQGFAVDEIAATTSELEETAETQLIVVDAVEFGSGLACCEEVRARRPDAFIALMVDDYDLASVAQAFRTGAVDGYLTKNIACEPLGESLRLIAMGEKLLPSQLANSLSASAAPSSPQWSGDREDLTSREVEILKCLVEGEANKVISRRLQITDATVKVHIKAILRKLRVKNRTQAAIWAVSSGFVRPPSSAQTAAADRPELALGAADSAPDDLDEAMTLASQRRRASTNSSG